MKTDTLRTGTKLFHNQFNSEYVTIKFNFGAGFIDDSSQEPGSLDYIYSKAHILEHIIALNSNKYDSIKQDSIVDAIVAYDAVTTNFITTYSMKLKSKDIPTVMPFIMNELFNPKITHEVLRKELEVIEIENVVAGLDYTNLTGAGLDVSTVNKEELEEISSKYVTEEMISKKESLLNVESLKEYHKEKYTPDNFVISIIGGNQKDFKIVKEIADKCLERYPDAEFKKMNVRVKTITDDIEELEEERFLVQEIPGDKSNFAHLYLSLPAYKDKQKNVMCGVLYSYFLSNKKFSHLRSPLIQHVRYARNSSYSESCRIENNNGKPRIVLEIPTTTKYVHTNLKAIRNILYKVASGKIINKKMFDNMKKSYIAFNKKNLIEQADSAEKSFVRQMFLNPKYKGVSLVNKRVENVSYDEFMAFAKYLHQTQNYTVACVGNDVTIDDLKAFEKIEKPKLVKQNYYANELDKTKLKEMVKTKDFEVR